MVRTLIVAAAVVATSCSGPNTFSGTVVGATFSPKEAVAALVQDTRGASDIVIVVSDAKNLCRTLQAGGTPANASLLTMTLLPYAPVDGSTEVAVGQYPVVNPRNEEGNLSVATFIQHDDTCRNALGDGTPTATAGAVHLVAFTENSPKLSAGGTFDIDFGPDHVTGDFAADDCLYTPTNTPTCQ